MCAEPTLLAEGQRIDPGYVVERFLGQGAFAEVYRVKHRFLGRQAMKVFKRLGSKAAVTEMLTEAVLLSRLGHPGIVRVFDAGTVPTPTGERGFFTMEYIAGGTLFQYWSENAPLPVSKAVRIIRDICAGLAIAHAEQPPIIHLDITPYNILIGPDGHARLGDLGLAKVSRPLPGQPRGAVTLAYAAPESVLGAVAESCATDVWALGAIAYLLLTDQHPYPAGRSRRSLPDPPSELNPEVDAPLDEIVLQALKSNPVDRTPNAVVLAAQLAQYEGATP